MGKAAISTQRPAYGSLYTPNTFPPSRSTERRSSMAASEGSPASSSVAANPVETPAGFLLRRAPLLPPAFFDLFSATVDNRNLLPMIFRRFYVRLDLLTRTF